LPGYRSRYCPYLRDDGSQEVRFQFSEFGSIHDLKLQLRWTAADLASQVLKRTTVLAAARIKLGSIIIIAHSGSAHFFADLFAVWSLGCTAACIDPGFTENEVKRLIDFVEPSAILIGADLPIGDAAGTPIFDLAGFSSSGESIVLPDHDSTRPALILFTSGTTGHPKGVVLTFHALMKRIALNRAAMGAACQMRALVTLPTSFGHGLIGNALTPLLSGGEIILHPPGLVLAQHLGHTIDRYQVGFLSSVPSFWRMVLKFSDAPVRGELVRVHVGSAPLSARLWSEIAEWSGAEVVNCYGITELANWVAGASSRVQRPADGLVGKPWGGTVAVKDASGDIREHGEGEVLVNSPSAMAGYLRRPDLTRNTFIDGWYCTGDVGHIDQYGSITLTGRIKDEINRAGRKVQPAELDALLEDHPAIAEACVFGINDLASGEIVAAAVRLRPGHDLSMESLRQWCAARVHREAVPERWFVVDEIQKNERGKLYRTAMRKSLCGGPQ
jgi:acyl-coenzyme A synthetase/AMP-(fatty) acid ligase